RRSAELGQDVVPRVPQRGHHRNQEESPPPAASEGNRNIMQMPADMGPVHILGIGGIGMSAIAEILHSRGYTVQGSDQKDSANVRRLRAKGIRVFVGHDAINLVGAKFIVMSTAVKAGNPELEAARKRRLPIIPPADMLP